MDGPRVLRSGKDERTHREKIRSGRERWQAVIFEVTFKKILYCIFLGIQQCRFRILRVRSRNNHFFIILISNSVPRMENFLKNNQVFLKFFHS